MTVISIICLLIMVVILIITINNMKRHLNFLEIFITNIIFLVATFECMNYVFSIGVDNKIKLTTEYVIYSVVTNFIIAQFKIEKRH